MKTLNKILAICIMITVTYPVWHILKTEGELLKQYKELYKEVLR